ncbi:MAG: GTP cyclohydrolase IIa [Desulfurococcales archaeon]|nr:GTP cyclohydrolase IIa [Desulfurococcales archaeon]
MGIDDLQIRIAVVELMGYREWTEELGSDREWMIQGIQAKLYGAAQQRASKLGGFVIPIRYDYMIVLASNLNKRAHKQILDTIKRHSPVKPRMASACSETPLAAEEAASNLLSKAGEGELYFDECEGREVAVVGHIDVDDITGLTRALGAYKSYMKVVEILAYLQGYISKWGGMTQYLGGDNVLAILPPPNFHDIVEKLRDVKGLKIKTGVGVAPTFRAALMLAAEALHDIRVNNSRFRVAVRVGNPLV